MAESQKGASSRKLNEKNSLLDMDIGNDFLTSWKSMSVAEDNAMDFDFAPVSKDKKKSFNFDNADMDFNLDADFGKIPSFNMDMSDLDTSSPLKRGGKSREKSKEKSENGKNTSKADHFSFELDFDEFGSFGFESSITEKGKKAEKNDDGEKIPKRSKCQEEKDPFDTKLIASKSSSDNELFGKSISTKNATTSGMDAQGERSAGIHSQSEESLSKFVQSDVGTSSLLDTIDQVASHNAGMSPDIEKTISPQPAYQEAFITDGVTQVPSAHSVSGEEADQITGSQIPKLDAMDANLSSSVGELNPVEKPIARLDSSSGNFLEKENSYFHGVPIPEKNNREESCVETEKNSLSGNKEMIEHAQGDSGTHNSSITTVAMGSEKINAENQEPAPEILKDNLTSQPVDNSASQKERGPLVTHSRFFMEPKKAEEHVQKAPSTQTTTSLSSNKARSPTPPSLLDEKRDRDTSHVVGDGKLASFSLQHSRAAISRKNNQPGKPESCNDLSIDRQGTSANGVQGGRKFNDSLFAGDQDVVEGNSAQDISQKNTNDVDNFSLNKQMGKNAPQNRPRISAAATTSLFTMENSAAEAGKSSPLNCSRRNPDPCGMKLSRTCGSDLDSSKSASQKDAKSLGNSMQNPILSANEASKITHSPSEKAFLLNMKNDAEAKKVSQAKSGGRNLDLCGMRLSRTSESDRDCMRSVGSKDVSPLGKITEKKLVPGNESSSSTLGKLKKTHTPPSLKRKTLEEFDSSTTLLNPSKRLSQSPTENRKFVAISERGVDKKVSKHDSLEDDSTKSTFDGYQDFTVGAPSSVENNTYIQQAEACTKELEDICNMLSKKHEEAKEILVRAIVNNNKLLMLNHPLYEEKIRMVQKFAAGLTLNETHA